MTHTRDKLNKFEAAAHLGLSVRRVLALVHDGRLKARKQRNPRHGQQTLLIDSRSIERYLETQKRIPGQAASLELQRMPPPGALAMRYTAPAPAAAAQRPLGAWEPHEWLTIEEAAAYTRLPATGVLGLIASDELPARDFGSSLRRRWRIKRTALDDLPERSATRPPA